jgi:hypothetical protein
LEIKNMSYETFHDVSYAQGQYNMDGDPGRVIGIKMSGYYYGSKQPYYDVQAARNYNNAIRLGKVPILYHFAGGADPIAEADFFVGACSPLAHGDILALDYELTAGMNPPSNPNDWCLKFVERVKERSGKYPLFYCNTSQQKQYGFSEVLKRCGFWQANYAVSPSADIAGSPPYIIQQFQGSPLDTNALFIPLDALKKYGYEDVQPQPAPSTPPPTPAPQPQPQPSPAPTPGPTPTPTPEPIPPSAPPDSPLDVENNNLLKQILSLLQGLIAKITGVFK